MDWQSEQSQEAPYRDIAACFSNAAVSPLAEHLPVVVPISLAALEDDDFFRTLNAERLFFALPDEVLGSERALARCRMLHDRGRHLVFQLSERQQIRGIPLVTFGHVRFDAGFARQDLDASDFAYLHDAGFKKIAANIESFEMSHWLEERKVEWYDSHFLTTHNPQRGNEPDLCRLKLLKLLNLVKQDGDTRDIEKIFREEARLSYNLLRLVNSVAVGARTRISNFSQAIAILGRRQLLRWLQLLVYADHLSDDHAPNPLMQLAAARGRKLELLSAAVEPIPDIPELSDNAFMTGLFSLLSVLINLPMSEILKEIPLQDEVVEALRNPAGGGVLGQLLQAITAGEAGNFKLAAQILGNLGISPETHAKSQVDALYWASRINSDAHE